MSVVLDSGAPPLAGLGLPARGRQRTVLCAVDGRALAGERVLCAATSLCRSWDARLVLLSVVRRPSVWAYFAGWSPARMAAELEDEAVGWLAEALARVPADIDAGALLRHGKPAQVIRAEVEDGGHAAIVLGRRPRAGAGRRLGSVSAKVVAAASVPIHVVPLPRAPAPLRRGAASR